MKIIKLVQKLFLRRNGEKKRLWAAISTNDEKKAIEVIKRGIVDINASYEYQGTALIKAASKGLIFVVRALLDAGAFIDAIDSQGNTALYSVLTGEFDNDPLIRERFEKIALLLIDRNANILLAPPNEHPPILAAASNYLIAVVEKLFDMYKSRNLDIDNLDVLRHIIKRFITDRTLDLNFSFIYKMINKGASISKADAAFLLFFIEVSSLMRLRLNEDEIPAGFINHLSWRAPTKKFGKAICYHFLLCMKKTADKNANELIKAGSNGPAKMILKYLF